ncbi:CII family transcriptional regulator [Candidatus Symbiopectobacterium sp.]|uniref:CII family transcriptional regulator n=1 Tax=Candidatus Symbiopectobacterium sp. TaxID=2816440 RepID=UPI0025BD352B|nr:CII family transcriptional regulator [Candidatus Symbiopectobacterium sp.]
MDITSTRKKARQIESQLLSRLALFGQRKFADFLNLDESQISRMKVARGKEKHSFFGLMSLALAILEWGVNDDELAHLAKQVALILTQKKKPTVAAGGSKVTMEF